MLSMAGSVSSLLLNRRESPEQLSVDSKYSISPLPQHLHSGLVAVSIFSLLSFISAAVLFCILCYRLIASRRSSLHRNQFFILILNLLIADIEQSIAFILNITWLRQDGISVGTRTCWAQGFFVSIGDLSSGVFTLLIAVHTFADIVFDRQPSYAQFLVAVCAGHAFVWACAALAIGLHPHDIYVRAGAWCWINSSYEGLRLWLHYLWILLAEFGTVALYSALFLILRRRLRSSYYDGSPRAARHARAAAKAIIPYPVVYVICTLPLAAARISAMAHNTPGYAELAFAGSMITSNGWLDVLLYSLTRRALIFGSNDGAASLRPMRALDTFGWEAPAAGPRAFGNTTVIEGGAKAAGAGDSTDELVRAQVKLRTEVAVHSAPVELAVRRGRPRTGAASTDEGMSERSWEKEDEF